MTYRVRLIEGIAPCYVVEPIIGRDGSGAPLVTVALPASAFERSGKVQEERRQLAEAICRLLNGALVL